VRRIIGAVALAGLLMAGTGAAGAHPEPAGTFGCRMAATKLGSHIEVTFRVRSSDPGHAWRVRLWDGAARFADRTRTADAEGRLRVVASTRNRGGRDDIVGVGRDLITGGRCRVELSI